MTHYAVLIGNSEFPKAELTQLTSPPKDVAALAAELAVEGRAFDEVISLINRPRPEIERTLERVFDSAGKNDLILLYYSGHGLPNNKNNDLYFATLDTETDLVKSTAISFENIYRWIRDSHCKRIVILLDCCYSGIAGQVFAKGDLNEQLKILNNKVTSTCLMTAASNDQVALDQADGGLSLFTKHLINGLRGEADHDGNITFDNLYDYVNKKVIEENGNQVPKKFAHNTNGQLVLAKSGRDSRKERAEKLWDYLHDLSKGKRITSDILAESLRIINKPLQDLSQAEKTKDDLISQCVSTQDSLRFALEWNRLDYAAQANTKQIEATQQAEVLRIRLEQEAEARATAQREKEKQEAAAKQLAESKRLEAEAAKKKAAEEKRAADDKRREQEVLAKRAEQADDLIKTEQAERAQREKNAAEQAAEAREAARFAALAEAAKNPNPPLKTPSNNKVSYAIAVVGVLGIGGWLASGSSAKKPVEPPVAPAVVEAPVASAAAIPQVVTNPLGITMVKIGAGGFTMGCKSGRDSDCSDDEKPEHTVSISAFELGKTEVTQGQWKSVMGSNPSNFSRCGDTCPVEQVSWDDVQTFIQKLNAQTGKTYRLPSEAEWEYACRAGQDTNYCGSNNVDSVAWYYSNSGGKTHPVGGKQENAWGLSDMSGNVWEWVQDTKHSDYNGAPANGSSWEGGVGRVLRGGSWYYIARSTRAAIRIYSSPASRNGDVGFRLARTPQ